MIKPIVQLDFQHPVHLDNPGRVVQNLVPSAPQQCELLGNAEVLNTGNFVRDNRIQKGLVLPATGSKLVFSDTGTLNRIMDRMTIEFNIEPTDVQLGGTQRIASRWVDGQRAFTINLKNGQIIFSISTDGTSRHKLESTAGLFNNEMAHVACTLGNGLMSIWINKKLNVQKDLGGAVNVAVSTAPLVLGTNTEDDDSYQFFGGLADFKLWDVDRKAFGRTYHIIAPSIVAIGEPFTVKLSRLSQKGNPYNGSEMVKIINASDFTGLPTTAFNLADVHQFESVVRNTEGISRVHLRVIGDNVEAESNPILVKPVVDRRFYWGDLHAHSNLEAGNQITNDHGHGSPSEVYFHAEHVAFLDVFALTGHAFRYRNQATDWQQLINHANMHYKTGDFVTILGHEWAGKSGGGERDWENGDDHHIVYHFGMGDECYISGINVPDQFYPGRGHITGNDQVDYTVCDSFDLLAPLLEPWGSVMIPHHLMAGKHYRGDPTPAHDAVMPVVEVYSEWGASFDHGEKRPTNAYYMVQDAGHQPRLAVDLLNDGYKIGFIGCSDTHGTKPGTPHYGGINMQYKAPGLTGFYCDDLTRFGIMDAFRSRRTVAVSQDRIILECRAIHDDIGYEMGETITVPANGIVTFQAEVAGITEFELELIRSGTVLASFLSADRYANVAEERQIGDSGWYMWRVRQVNEETAWASPFFVEVAG